MVQVAISTEDGPWTNMMFDDIDVESISMSKEKLPKQKGQTTILMMRTYSLPYHGRRSALI
jgi:hypothetical protein